MAHSMHPISFWLYLIPDNISSIRLQGIRNKIIYDDGTINFPLHLTISNVASIQPQLYSELLNLNISSLNNLNFKLRTNFKNYFNSISYIPVEKEIFNEKIYSIFKKLNIEYSRKNDPHVSLYYGECNYDQNQSIKERNIQISFNKISIAFVDEKKEIWKLI